MIIDADTSLATTVAFDLETQRPGPGQELTLAINDVPAGDLDITHSDTEGGTYTALQTIVVPAEKRVVATLQSSAKRWIKATFASGSVQIVLNGGTQTAN